MLCEPVQNLDHVDVSHLLKLPTASLTAPVVEPEKPKRCLTAYNLFFREERKKLLEALPCRQEGKPKHSHGKISFKELARTVSVSWKAATEYEKQHFKNLASVEKQRYKKAMQEYKEKIEQQRSEQDALLARAVMDLPLSLESIFDDGEPLTIDIYPDIEMPQVVSSSFSAPPSTRMTQEPIIPSSATVVSESSTESDSEISLQGQSQMEKVFGGFPTSLLGSIANDDDWPF